MNQTKKRLSIIKLAISITDLETIQLQVLKLLPIKTDAKLQDILALLQRENYAQAQGLITTYIETQTDEVVQRTAVKDSTVISDEDQRTIDEFQLFVTPTVQSEQKTVEINIQDYVSDEPDVTIQNNQHTSNTDYDSLLNLDANDVLKDNIDIDISATTIPKQDTDTFFELEKEEVDSFFAEESIELPETPSKEEVAFDAAELHPDEEEEEVSATPSPETQKESIIYDAIPHISQKLISTKKRYPPIQKTYETFDTVEALLTKISQDGYSESEIEEMTTYIKQLIVKGNYTEAAELLLVCGSTDSKFAQFMLARELYTGSVLSKNIAEAFTLMNTLAIDDYPEALCDLGQFYENGIGTTPDTMKAESLYKEAVNLGIKRAKKHYTRLKKQNRGFFKA